MSAARSPRTGAARRSTARSRATATAATGAQSAAEAEVRGKRVTFDLETWHALELLARESMKDFQELADEAFSDLLRKHGRPSDLKTALRRSAAAPRRDKAKDTDR